MDYTIHDIRPLIYKDRESIECFNIDDEKALDAAMLELIEKSPIIELDGANGYILEIFNNAYYIVTLIRMEKHPMQFFRKYITIAEHTGSAYYDVYEKNTYYDYFSAFTMAMACNYLRLLDDNYLGEDNLFIKKVTEHFRKFFKPTSSREDAYCVFRANLMSIDVLYSYNLDKKSFVRRKIDEQAVYDTKAHFIRKYPTWSKMLINCGFKSYEQFIKGICRTEEEEIILVNTIRKEESIVPNVDMPFATTGLPHTPVQTTQEHHEEEQKNTIELEERIKELEKEIASLKQQLGEERQKNQSIDDFSGLDEVQKMNLHQKIVFFTTVTSVMLDKRYTNMRNLASFIASMCNEKPSTIGPMLSRIGQITDDNPNPQLSATLHSAAQCVSDMLGSILTDETKHDKSQKINKIKDSLLLNYPLPEDE